MLARCLTLLLFSAWLSLFTISSAWAQIETASRPFETVYNGWDSELNQIKAQLSRPGVTKDQLDSLRKRIEIVRREAEDYLAATMQDLAAAKRLGEALGPAPSPTDPDSSPASEPPEFTKDRERLANDIAITQTRERAVRLILAKVGNLKESISLLTSQDLIATLLTRGPDLFDLEMIKIGTRDLLGMVVQTGEHVSTAWNAAELSLHKALPLNPHLVWVAYLFLLSVLAAVIMRVLLKRFGRPDHIAKPSYHRRVAGGLAVLAVAGILPALVLQAVLAPIYLTGSLSEEVTDTIGSMSSDVGITVMYIAALRGVLAPGHAQWRVVDMPDWVAWRLYRGLSLLMLVIASLTVPVAGVPEGSMQNPALSLYDFIGSMAIACVALPLMSPTLWRGLLKLPTDDPDNQAGGLGATRQVIRLGLAVILITLPILSLFGYGALVSYALHRMADLGLLIAALILVRGLIRELWAIALSGRGPVSRRFLNSIGVSTQQAPRLRFWLDTLSGMVLAAVGVVAALLVAGVPPSELDRFGEMLIKGVEVGGLTVSVGRVLLAILGFVLMVMLTRFVQRFLEQRVFLEANIDPGVRHSLKAVSGYIGITLAILLGISLLGIDLSSVALVLSALSVGIGFGLKNIANDFVCGLILLIERPVKVGDWINVGGKSGFVTSINTRSTELRTFDRAHIVIPNSQVLETAIVNWTHHDRLIRMDTPIASSYGVDLDRLEKILLECTEHENVTKDPPAYFFIGDLAQGAIKTELRFYLVDTDHYFTTTTEIRKRVARRLVEEGLEIPKPQAEVHVATDALAAVAAAGAAAPMPSGPIIDTSAPRKPDTVDEPPTSVRSNKAIDGAPAGSKKR